MCYSALVKQDLKHLAHTYGAIAVRQQLDDYERMSWEDPKRFPKIAARIFPGTYAAVVFQRDGKRVVEYMRYGVYPPPTIKNPERYTTFNARRDNLISPFWSQAFMHHHGFVVLEGFFEWVAVRDLLKAGLVTMTDVLEEFAKQAAERKAKIEVAGKKYKPTPTELKDPLTRPIIIQFQATQTQDLLVPVIFTEPRLQDGQIFKGFAIVTDDPPQEILAAGHDRCPIILAPQAIEAWLHLKKKTMAKVEEILDERQPVTFIHKLAEQTA